MAKKAKDKGEVKERKFRGWWTHDFFDRTLSEVQEMAVDNDIELADPNNPTPEELAEVYKAAFEEMSDPWEITANGDCKVEEVKE
jgi:hypothetical protein